MKYTKIICFYHAICLLSCSIRVDDNNENKKSCKTSECVQFKAHFQDASEYVDTPSDDTKKSENNDSALQLSEKSSVFEIVKDYPITQEWQTLAEPVKLLLKQKAESFFDAYYHQWGKTSITKEIEKSLIEKTQNREQMFQNFLRSHFFAEKKMYAESEKNIIISNQTLQKILKKLFVLRVFAWQVLYPLFMNTEPLYPDGVTRITTFPLPDNQTLQEQKLVASDLRKEIMALSRKDLSNFEKAIALKAELYIQQHERGTVLSFQGGEDFHHLTQMIRFAEYFTLAYFSHGNIYSHEKTTDYLPVNVTDDHESIAQNFFLDDNSFIDQLNALFFLPLDTAGIGEVVAFDYYMYNYFDDSFIVSNIGDPQNNVTAKVFFLLLKWFRERYINESEDHFCFAYSQDNLKDLWNGFIADLVILPSEVSAELDLVQNSSTTSFARLENNFRSFSFSLTDNYKQRLYDALVNFTFETELTVEQKNQIASDFSSVSVYGKILPSFLDAVAHRLGQQEAEKFKTQLYQAKRIGGYGDLGENIRNEDNVYLQKIWSDILWYLSTTHNGFDEALLSLPQQVIVKNQKKSQLHQDEIWVGVKEEHHIFFYYWQMYHLAYQMIRSKKYFAVNEPFWNIGLPSYLKYFLFSDLDYIVRKDSLISINELNLSRIAAFSEETLFLASTDTTLKNLLLSKCTQPDHDAFLYARQVAFHDWGVSLNELDLVAYRANMRAEYLSAFMSHFAVSGTLNYLQKELSPYHIDPFILLACNIAIPHQDDYTKQILFECLKKQ